MHLEDGKWALTRLCSIDVTGNDIVLGWILEALDPCADLTAHACMALPPLDAYVAAVLAEAKHLKGDLWVFSFKQTVNSASS